MRQQLSNRSLTAFGAAGFLTGACLALVAVAIFTLSRFGQAAAVVSLTATVAAYTLTPSVTPTATVVIIPTATATRPPTSTPVPTESPQDILDWAEEYIGSGSNPQQLIDRLSPVLDQFTEVEDLSRAHSYLGAAEYLLGHYLLAAGHFEYLYEYDPTPENLVLVASSYDLGGDLPHALGGYLQLADWPGPAADAFRNYARERVEAIIQIIGTPTPST